MQLMVQKRVYLIADRWEGREEGSHHHSVQVGVTVFWHMYSAAFIALHCIRVRIRPSSVMLSHLVLLLLMMVVMMIW